MSIGDRIRHLRWDARLNQGELAHRAGIAQNTLSLIELGKTNASVPTLEKISRGLGIELSELLGESAAPKVLRPRSLDELLGRTGLKTRWLTKPREEFDKWWLDVDWEEAKRRFWEINAEYRAIAAEWEVFMRDRSRVAPELEEQLHKIREDAFFRHFGAMAAAPGKDESVEDFYERQSRGELRQFKQIELEKAPEELLAPASQLEA